MRCSCCGRMKKPFESFESLGKGKSVCVDCSDLLYRIHDAVTEKQRDEYDKRVRSVTDYISAKKASEEFRIWFQEDFLQRNIYVTVQTAGK